MSMNAMNLIAGAGQLWTGAFGVTEPATPSTAPGTGWTDVGATDGGCKVSWKQDYVELDVDQTYLTPERRKTKEEISVETTLAEPTLANLNLALNNVATVATAAGVSTFTPGSGLTNANIPSYSALLFDGIAAGSNTQNLRRRVVVRKVLSTEGFEIEYKKDDKTTFGVTFAAHFISDSVKPLTWSDVAPV